VLSLEHPTIDFSSGLIEVLGMNGVVSLYDVLRFMAENFWKAAQILTEWGFSAGFGLHLPPSKTFETMEALSKLQQNVRELGLPVSAQELHKLNISMKNAVSDIERLPPERQKAEFERVSAEMRLRFDNVSSVIHSELSQRLLYAVTTEKAQYCDPQWLTDTAIFSAFPKAFAEFQRAEYCYAFDECTAAIFHLMRVIDSGLRLVYESLGETYDARNWNGIAKKIESEMSKKYQDKTEEWRKKDTFYSEVLTDIRSIGRAHRNPALHDIDRKYSDADAKYLIEVTKAFMSHLAQNGMKE
jgi:hypothetical protein